MSPPFVTNPSLYRRAGGQVSRRRRQYRPACNEYGNVIELERSRCAEHRAILPSYATTDIADESVAKRRRRRCLLRSLARSSPLSCASYLDSYTAPDVSKSQERDTADVFMCWRWQLQSASRPRWVALQHLGSTAERRPYTLDLQIQATCQFELPSHDDWWVAIVMRLLLSWAIRIAGPFVEVLTLAVKKLPLSRFLRSRFLSNGKVMQLQRSLSNEWVHALLYEVLK